MQTSAIRYRVVDFLKEYPPFQAMEDDDLLALVARGRVRFHEIDEYVYWQGKPPGDQFFVIQQGAVSLVEEGGETERLRDVRGPGDLLGVDGLLSAATYPYSAKAASDVILYALPTQDMEPLLTRYPSAGRYVAAHASVSASYESPDARRLHRTRVRPRHQPAPAARIVRADRSHPRGGATDERSRVDGDCGPLGGRGLARDRHQRTHPGLAGRGYSRGRPARRDPDRRAPGHRRAEHHR